MESVFTAVGLIIAMAAMLIALGVFLSKSFGKRFDFLSDDIKRVETSLTSEINRVETSLSKVEANLKAEIAESRLDTKALEARVFELATAQKLTARPNEEVHTAKYPSRRKITEAVLQ